MIKLIDSFQTRCAWITLYLRIVLGSLTILSWQYLWWKILYIYKIFVLCSFQCPLPLHFRESACIYYHRTTHLSTSFRKSFYIFFRISSAEKCLWTAELQGSWASDGRPLLEATCLVYDASRINASTFFTFWKNFFNRVLFGYSFWERVFVLGTYSKRMP